jgi:hypothetical protein
MLSTVKLILAVLTFAMVGSAAHAMHPQTDLIVRWTSPDGEVLSERILEEADIAALEQREIRTNTPWTDGVQTFSGPPIGVLAALGPLRARQATFIALNAYLETLPAEDWTEHGAILAVKRNGMHMDIREHGPYWVMYPIDSDPDTLDTQRYYGRMVWQVKEIVFVVE